MGRDIQILTDGFHPFASGASYGDDELIAGEAAFGGLDLIALFSLHDLGNLGVEMKFDLVLYLIIEVLEHYVVLVRSQMSYLGFEKFQVVLETFLLDT